jgi:hypothetical protein
MQHLTNLHSNSRSGVLYEIRQEEAIHPFYGLRKAELMILAAERTLLHARLSMAAGERDRNKWLLRKEALSGEANKTPQQDDELFNLEQDLQRYDFEYPVMLDQYRDMELERNIAISEKLRILAEHPEFLQKDFNQLQEEFSEEALLNKLAMAVAAKLWAGQSLEAVGELFFGLGQQQRDYVMRKELEYRTGIKGNEIMAHCLVVLGQLSEASRTKILLTAANSITESQASKAPFTFPLNLNTNG